MAGQKRKSEAAPTTSDSTPKRKRPAAVATAAAQRPRRTAKTAEPAAAPVASRPNSKGTTKEAAVATKAATTKKTGPPKSKAAPAAAPSTAKSPRPKAPKPAAAAASSDEARAAGGRCYWLMKAEPESRMEKGVDVKFSIDDLAARTAPEPWDGVRNPVAQKNMRSMRKGDLAFFYHSNCKVPGIAGVMEIVQEHSVDESAFDPAHPYYDPKSVREKPRWSVVHVAHLRTLDALIPLRTLQQHAQPGEPLAAMQVLRMARLSVSRVEPAEWTFILGELAGLQEADLQHR